MLRARFEVVRKVTVQAEDEVVLRANGPGRRRQRGLAAQARQGIASQGRDRRELVRPDRVDRVAARPEALANPARAEQPCAGRAVFAADALEPGIDRFILERRRTDRERPQHVSSAADATAD